MIENCIFSVLFNLCTLLGLIKVCEPKVWAAGVVHYIFAKPHLGAKEDQSMLCLTKSLGLYHVVCLGSVSLGSFCENMAARRTYYKCKNIDIYGH